MYRKGLIAELIGKIKATVQAYIPGETVISSSCASIETMDNGTQVQKSVNTIANIFIARLKSVFISSLRPDALFA